MISHLFIGQFNPQSLACMDANPDIIIPIVKTQNQKKIDMRGFHRTATISLAQTGREFSVTFFINYHQLL